MLRNFILVAFTLCATTLYALQGGPTQPDYAQFEPSEMPDLVSMQTGNFAYSLPLGELPGPYGNYPLSVAYHAGISPQQEATWVGLGWTLNPGVINRDVRGVPDDQFHGGTLGFIYQYSAMQTWTLDMGWSYGIFRVGSTTTNEGGVGFSATIGPKIAGVAGVGFTVGTDAVGIEARVGYQNVGLNASLMMSTSDGSTVAGVSVSASIGPADASAGVQKASGQKASYNVGFGVGAGGTKVGMTLSSNGVSYQMNAGPLSISSGNRGGGANISVGGSSISVSNSATKGGTHTSTVGFAIVVPTCIGVFSMGFSQSLHEYWMRSATSDYVYGYIYQAGPAIVVDGSNDMAGLPNASSGSYDGSGPVPWKWTLKGRTLEALGNEDLHPAYDMYSVASEGVSGTFRPFAREEHQLYKKLSNEKTTSHTNTDEYSTILLDSTNSWPYMNEFGDTLADSKYPSYDYCVHSDSCSPYALYATYFRNEGNRLVYRKNKEIPDTTRTGMTFLFAGDGGGYFESESLGEGIGRGKNQVSSKALRRTLNDYQYALYGSRKVEPVFEDDSPVGKLKGFVVTSSDGSKYYFEQPVRSYLKVDYSFNKEKGAPAFIDLTGDETENFIKNLAQGLWNMLSYGWGRSSIAGSASTLFLDPTWGAMATYHAVSNTVFKKGTLAETCSVNDKDDSNDYFYSYQVDANSYVTQWLLSEIRGADFVKLGDSISDNVGYNVKFNYSKPSLYRWRTPFARPGLTIDDMPNFRTPKNGYTPEGCDSRMYQASFGVKEYVYLESIETATHRVTFTLNDPKTEERVDGKGWDISARQRSGELPIMVQAAVEFRGDAEDSTVCRLWMGTQQCLLVKLSPRWLYVNSRIPDLLLENMKNRGITVMNIDSVASSTSHGSGRGLYNMRGQMTFKVLDTAQILQQTTGDETKYGLYKIRIASSNDSAYSANIFSSTLFSDSVMVFGEAGNYRMNPYLTWGDLVWSQDSSNYFEIRMRYLKKISYYNKQDTTPYREFVFGYDYSLHPKTLNSYCSGRYPDSISQITASPDSVGLDVCARDTSHSLYGRLTLKSVTEKGCQNGRCASLPPFQFTYNSPSATASRISTKDGWVSLSQGLSIYADTATGDTTTLEQYPDNYYENITDVDASIIASSNAIDEWGFWARNATSENHKAEQDFADYGASAWSLNKVTDPAGGALEVEYERDVYQNGEDYSNDKDFAEAADFGLCSDYKTKQSFSDESYDVPESLGSNLCIEVGDLYWREQCLGPRAAFWDSIRPAGYVGSGFAYLDSIGVTDSAQTLYYNLKADMGTKGRCGLFGKAHCSRKRSLALLGDGQVDSILLPSNGNPERRLLVLSRPWTTIEAGFQVAADKINSSQSWRIKGGNSRMGFLWSRHEFPEMKGGDLRVKRLTRYDIDRTAQTVYDYAPGEIAQLPDSAYNTVLGNRFYASKISYALPDIDMLPKSRIVGFDDNDLFYVPGATITYPKVSVRNTDSDGNTRNGRTEFDYITPETGVPEEYVDEETRSKLLPFLKLNVRLFKWGGDPSNGYYPYRAFLARFTLLDSSLSPIGSTHKVLISQNEEASFTFYGSGIRNARYLVGASRYSPSKPICQDTIEITDFLTHFNEMSISIAWNLSTQNFSLHKSWLRSQKVGFYPILYKAVEYVSEGVSMPPIDHGDYENDSAEFEHKVTYHDLTAFLGLNYKTAFYRGIGVDSIPIKVDSSIYSTIVPDILSGVDNTASADSVRKKVGRQVERWHYHRVLQCTYDNKGNDRICEHQYASIFERDSMKDSKNFTYIRYPAFQVGSVTYTGHENQTAGGSSNLWTWSSLENHRFDPLTGSPTATLAKTPSFAGEMRKLTQKTPHYMLFGDTALANEMFRRNMLSQNFLDEVYSGTVDSSAVWNSIAVKDSLRSFSVSPFRFLPDSVYSRDIAPIVAWGTYKSKALPQDIISGSEVLSALSIYADASDTLPPLSLFDGTHIRSVDKHFKVRETEDAWGRILSTHYSSDGAYQTSLFFPAKLSETASLVPNQKGVALENCSVSGTAYFVDVAHGGLSSTGSISVSCSPSSSSNLVAEDRIKKNGEWSTERQLLMTSSFSLALSSGDALNYLRIYPDEAEAKTFLYDFYGNLVQAVAEDNTSSYYEYDPFGNLVQIRDDDGVSYKTHHREFWNDSLDVVPVTVGK